MRIKLSLSNMYYCFFQKKKRKENEHHIKSFFFTKVCLLNDEDLKESQFPLAGDMHDLIV